LQTMNDESTAVDPALSGVMGITPVSAPNDSPPPTFFEDEFPFYFKPNPGRLNSIPSMQCL